MALFTGVCFYLHGDFSSVGKEELRAMIERNGGRVTVRLTTKTSYVVSSMLTKEIDEKAKAHNTSVLNENYVVECINARKRLSTNNFLSKPSGKRVSRGDTEDPNVYNFATSSDESTDKENYINKIRDKLKKFSIKNKKREKEDVDDGLMINSSKKLKLVANSREEDGEGAALPPLKDLIFFIFGQFSIPVDTLHKLILVNGGAIANTVDDKVTHFLFGGESVDIPEFHEAQRLKIHIVNEYFLRLLVKY